MLKSKWVSFTIYLIFKDNCESANIDTLLTLILDK